MITEIWKPVAGYEGLYEASSLGRVKSLERVVMKRHSSGAAMRQVYKERILQPLPNSEGYLVTKIGILGWKRKLGIHEMVLRAFSGEPKLGQITRHLNGNPSDNRPENLAWGTHFENMADRKRHGRYKKRGEHVMAKLTQADVDYIRASSKSPKDLSAEFGIGFSQISRVRRNQSWVDAA